MCLNDKEMRDMALKISMDMQRKIRENIEREYYRRMYTPLDILSGINIKRKYLVCA